MNLAAYWRNGGFSLSQAQAFLNASRCYRDSVSFFGCLRAADLGLAFVAGSHPFVDSRLSPQEKQREELEVAKLLYRHGRVDFAKVFADIRRELPTSVDQPSLAAAMLNVYFETVSGPHAFVSPLALISDLEKSASRGNSLNVTASILDQTGYIRIRSLMGDQDVRMVEVALFDFARRSVRSVILDLRSDSGGLLPHAQGIASLFVPEGQKLFGTRSILDGREEIFWSAQAPAFNRPLVVIVDAATKSSAEVLVGALQNQNKAFVVGDRTFGKGTVQDEYARNVVVRGDVALRSTAFTFIATNQGKYFIQQNGIVPDRFVDPVQGGRERDLYLNPLLPPIASAPAPAFARAVHVNLCVDAQAEHLSRDRALDIALRAAHCL